MSPTHANSKSILFHFRIWIWQIGNAIVVCCFLVVRSNISNNNNNNKNTFDRMNSGIELVIKYGVVKERGLLINFLRFICAMPAIDDISFPIVYGQVGDYPWSNFWMTEWAPNQ